jgi:hypothetical protein
MLFRKLFDLVKRGPPRRWPGSCRLAVEALDDRIVPAAHASPSLAVGSAVVAEGNAGTTTAAVVVTLANPKAHQTTTVNYATQGSTAVAGEDYVAASGTLTFAPGETSKTVAVPVIGDRIAEPYEEQFVVKLSGAQNATIAPGYGVVTIVDNEPRITIGSSEGGYNGASGTTPITFTVSLSAAYDQAVTVNYATADDTAVAGVDYVAASGTLTFAPGETTKTFTVEVIGYTTTEPYTDFVVNLSGASANAFVAGGSALGFIYTDAYDPNAGATIDSGGYDAGYYWY